MQKIFSLIGLLFLFSCGAENNSTESTAKNDEILQQEKIASKLLSLTKDGISLTEFNDYPKFNDAEISMISPKDKVVSGHTTFEFSVNNFPLGVKTTEEERWKIKSLTEGQHIKLINSGRLAKISNNGMLEDELWMGENYVFAVLSRSYNLTVHDSPKAYALTKISISDNHSKIEALKGKHVIPISPSGEYAVEVSKKILLDFYVLNTFLKEGGDAVVITIDQTEFKIYKWVPFFIEGLTAGLHTVSFKLVDSKGVLIPGPFNDLGKIEFTIKDRNKLLN